MICGDLQAVNVRQRAERRRARHEKVTEQPWIGPGGRWHPDEETIERLRFFGRRQEVEIVALAHWLRLGRAEYFPASDNQCRPRPARDQPASQVRTGGQYRIANDLTSKLSRQVELNAARRGIGARKRHVELAGSERLRPALNQQRQQDHDKGNIEK